MAADETSTTFVGSHEKGRAGYGTNGDPNASSVLPGKAQPKLVEPKVAPPAAHTANANAKDDDARLAAIMGHPIKHHDSMRHRGLDDIGSPTGKVPSANVRRSRTDGVGRPTK